MIRLLKSDEIGVILEIINEAARAYQGVIPADCWKDPYMPESELREELAAGVQFWGCEADGRVVGVMGRQEVKDVVLIRHAYVLSAYQRRGIGSRLLTHLRQGVAKPLLVGTWAAAWWAIRFYQQHGFKLVTPAEKDRFLRTYWHIPDRQIDTSVVLADENWFRRESPGISPPG
jgi:GNAT superfamily N-acetyltransferase